MTRGPGAEVLLERALRESARASGTALSIGTVRARHWRSATFSGLNHEIEARAPAAAALPDGWLARLPALDLPLRGHLLAQLTVAETARGADGVAFRIDAVTVER